MTRGFEAIVAAALVFVVGGLIVNVVFDAVTQTLESIGLPWYLWIVIFVGIVALMASDVSEIMAGGLIFAIFVMIFAAAFGEWIEVGVTLLAVVIGMIVKER